MAGSALATLVIAAVALILFSGRNAARLAAAVLPAEQFAAKLTNETTNKASSIQPEPAIAEDPGAPTPVSETMDLPTVQGAVTRATRRFGNAPGFRPALTAAGCDDDEYAELERALSTVMDFRRCRPEDSMTFERDAGGTLVLFEYRGAGATEFFRAHRNDGGSLRAERIVIPVDVEPVATGGVVRSSLGDAIVGAGLGRSLVNVVIAAFDGKADFSTDTRRGDAFRIVVDEKRIQGRFHDYGTVHAVEYRGQRTGTLRAFWFAERRGARGEFWDETGRAMQGGRLRTPCRYDRISSPFDPHRMHPILGRVRPHNGVDYAAGTGTPVWAAGDGTVTFAGSRGANGNLVSLRHANGFETHYAHLSRIARGLTRGERVEQRQVIGFVGTTGRSTGPHLHFGLKRRGRFVDPMNHLNGPGRSMTRGALRRFRRTVRQLRAELEAVEAGDAAQRSPLEPNGEQPLARATTH